MELQWYRRPLFIRIMTGALIVLVAAKFVHSVFFKRNDFNVHYHWGLRALNGDWHPGAFQYPPGRLLFDQALALMPILVARALCFSLAIVSVYFIYRIWCELAERMKPATPGVDFAAAVLAFLMFAPWAVRDLDECGLQILLLFMLSMAAHALYHGRWIQTGAWLGAAITFKVTPWLFVVLLIWKRRFLEAAAAVGFVVVFNLALPALFWGPEKAWEGVLAHRDMVVRSMALEDPSDNGIETPSHRSQSLKLAITRFLQTYPPGHPLFIDRDYQDMAGCTKRNIPPENCIQHPLFVQFLDLPPPTAKTITMAVIVLMGLAVAWRMRRRWTLADSGPPGAQTSALAPEWAVACMFTVLLSPLVWHQHFVLALPCAYLVIRDQLMRTDGARLRLALLIVIAVCVWLLQRDPLPHRISLVVMSYHEDVAAMLLLVVLTLTVQGAFGMQSQQRKPAMAPSVAPS